MTIRILTPRILNSPQTLQVLGRAVTMMHLQENPPEKFLTNQRLQFVGLCVAKAIIGKKVSISDEDVKNYINCSEDVHPLISELCVASITMTAKGKSCFTKEGVKHEVVQQLMAHNLFPPNKYHDALMKSKNGFLQMLEIYAAPPQLQTHAAAIWIIKTGTLLCLLHKCLSNDESFLCRYDRLIGQLTNENVSVINEFFSELNAKLDDYINLDPLDIDGNPTTRSAFYLK